MDPPFVNVLYVQASAQRSVGPLVEGGGLARVVEHDLSGCYRGQHVEQRPAKTTVQFANMGQQHVSGRVTHV